MNSETKLAADQLGGFKVTMNIDTRLTLPADSLKDWVSELGQSDFTAFVSAPGFPAPTDSTADLPMGQREWPAAAVWLFMLRADGFDVREQGELDASIPCMLKIDVCRPD